VFVTGRSVQGGAAVDEDVEHVERVTRIRCDHRVDAEVTAAFERVVRQN
jgi:hypothetical protein